MPLGSLPERFFDVQKLWITGVPMRGLYYRWRSVRDEDAEQDEIRTKARLKQRFSQVRGCSGIRQAIPNDRTPPLFVTFAFARRSSSE